MVTEQQIAHTDVRTNGVVYRVFAAGYAELLENNTTAPMPSFLRRSRYHGWQNLSGYPIARKYYTALEAAYQALLDAEATDA